MCSTVNLSYSEFLFIHFFKIDSIWIRYPFKKSLDNYLFSDVPNLFLRFRVAIACIPYSLVPFFHPVNSFPSFGVSFLLSHKGV